MIIEIEKWRAARRQGPHAGDRAEAFQRAKRHYTELAAAYVRGEAVAPAEIDRVLRQIRRQP